MTKRTLGSNRARYRTALRRALGVARSLATTRMQFCAGTSLPVALAALAAIGCSPSASAVTEAPVASRQREHYQVDAAKTVVELQPFRRASSIQAATSGSQIGKATLIELNPEVNVWYLLALDFSLQGMRTTYHLENRDPLSQRLRLDASYPSGVLIDSRGGKSACDLWSAAPTALEQARRSGQPYAPLCDARLYLRNAVTGRATALERVTDFLRDHVWAGEKIIGFVQKELFRDAFLERAAPGSSRAPAGAEPALSDGPEPASLDPAASGRMVQPAHLGLDLASAGRELLLGRWYRVNGLPGVFASVVQPRAVSSEILAGHRATVNALDPVEAEALVYLVAFDLAAFDLGFAIGTTHPRVDWSTRVLSEVRDETIPGPDGIGTLAPLVANGMISPALAGRTVATFTGGFKREHSAFRYGVLARQNHGSHYGLVEQGAVLSKLVPGLATLHVFNDGTVAMKTWTERDDILLSRIRHARQNGVPLIEHDAATGRSTPGPLVAQWGAGNWSGSAEGNLRTLRAGACLQESGSGRFLVYGYFSSATPSAMARTFQAYGCRYAMHLDMNALEHTYLALYVRRDDQLEVEHLIQGMAQLDQKSAQGLVPRFLGIPDDRDFFYVTRRERPR